MVKPADPSVIAKADKFSSTTEQYAPTRVQEIIVNALKDDPEAQRVALALAEHETNFNNMAVGDNQSSRGPFQIYLKARPGYADVNLHDEQGISRVAGDIKKGMDMLRKKGLHGDELYNAMITSWNPGNPKYTDNVKQTKSWLGDTSTFGLAKAGVVGPSGIVAPNAPPDTQITTGYTPPFQKTDKQLADARNQQTTDNSYNETDSSMRDFETTAGGGGVGGTDGGSVGVSYGMPQTQRMDLQPLVAGAFQQYKTDLDKEMRMYLTEKGTLQREQAQLQKDLDSSLKEYTTAKADPDRWWKNRDTFQKVSAVLANALGGFVEGFSMGRVRNNTMALIDNAIKTDIQIQLDEIKRLGSKVDVNNNLLARNLKQFGDLNLSIYQTRAQLSQGLQVKLQGIKMLGGKPVDPLDQALKAAKIQKIQTDLNATNSKQLEPKVIQDFTMRMENAAGLYTLMNELKREKVSLDKLSVWLSGLTGSKAARYAPLLDYFARSVYRQVEKGAFTNQDVKAAREAIMSKNWFGVEKIVGQNLSRLVAKELRETNQEVESLRVSGYNVAGLESAARSALKRINSSVGQQSVK